MLAAARTLDLCDSCSEADLCLSSPRRPILYCEQFDNYTPPAKKKPVQVIKTNFHSEKNENDAKLLGLCIDCDFRAECPFSKRQGGVWHCEEYK